MRVLIFLYAFGRKLHIPLQMLGQDIFALFLKNYFLNEMRRKFMKKVLSILLAVLMLASVCTIAVSAEEITPNDLGVTVISRGEITDDPTGTGEKVLPLNATNDRPNFELADPDDNTKKWEPVAGTTYTVTFDYYLASGTDFSGFALYYGAQSAYSANYSKSAITSANSGISGEFIGDGKWHTAAMSFAAYQVKGKVNGAADQVLPYLYLTYYGTFKGYVKNINIVTETYPVSYDHGKYDFGVYFDETGAPKADLFHETVKYTVPGASLMTNSYVNAAGETVFVPTNDNAPVTNNNRVINAYDCIDVLNASAAQVKTGGRNATGSPSTYAYIVLKYKVNKIGESGKATIGVGRASTTEGSTCLFQSVDVTEASDEWQYLTYKLVNQGNYVFRIVLGGVGSEIAIESFEFAHTVYNENVVAMFVNDNGEYSTYVGYKGTDLTVDDGANAENLAMGEKFLGWYSDANLTTEATKVPEANATIYAKYPTVIIEDFAMVKNYTANVDKGSNVYKLANENGKLTFTARNTGFMIPAYNDSTKAFAKFVPGQKYILTVYYDSFIGESTDAEKYEAPESTTVQTLYSDGYGTGAVRKIGDSVSKTLPSTNGTVKYSFTMPNYTSAVTESGVIDTMMIRLNAGNGSEEYGNFTMVIDKITITAFDDLDPVKDKDLVAEGSIRGEGTDEQTGEYVSAGIRFKGRVSGDFRESASEIGFYAVPTAALNGASIEDYLASANTSMALSAKVKADGMEEVVYQVSTDNYGRKSYDYQLIITGLTREGVQVNLLDTEITCVMYAVVNDQTVYTNTQAYCYNDVANK